MDLLAPVDDPQRAVLNMLWSQYQVHGRFPAFGWLEYQLSLSGHDAGAAIGGMPTIRIPDVHGGTYAAVWTSRPPLANETPVHLTVAGLYQQMLQGDGLASTIVGCILAHLRDMADARSVVADRPFDPPAVHGSLRLSLEKDGQLKMLPLVAPILEREWIAVSLSETSELPYSAEANPISTLRMLRDPRYNTAQEYLSALAALSIPDEPTVPTYTDPFSLVRAIGHFDTTTELVFKTPVVTRTPIERTAKLSHDVGSLDELYVGIGAVGELLQELQVDGKKGVPPVLRLLDHLVTRQPNIDRGIVQSAVDVLDAVRVIRNGGLHPKQKPELVQAHMRIGIPFPIRDPAAAWDTMRAQLTVAFDNLQGEIYANK